MDDITVDLGEIDIDHANTLLLCVMRAIQGANLWNAENYQRALALEAMLTYRIALATKETVA